MKLISLALAMITAICLPISVNADDKPKRSAELQVLDRFIGEWETVITIKGSDEKTTRIENRKWSQDGKFVLYDNQEEPGKRESHFLITYDSKKGLYRACFINDEFTVPLLGTWDEKSMSMKWKSEHVAFNHDALNRIIDKDNMEWEMTVTSPEGKIVLELSAKQTRRKK
jgi:hypothetical protein